MGPFSLKYAVAAKMSEGQNTSVIHVNAKPINFILKATYWLCLLIAMSILCVGKAFWVGLGWSYHLRDLAILASLGHFIIYTVQMIVTFMGESTPPKMDLFLCLIGVIFNLSCGVTTFATASSNTMYFFVFFHGDQSVCCLHPGNGRCGQPRGFLHHQAVQGGRFRERFRGGGRPGRHQPVRRHHSRHHADGGGLRQPNDLRAKQPANVAQSHRRLFRSQRPLQILSS